MIYDKIRAGATINRPDGTFSFSYLPYYKEFTKFEHEAQRIIDQIRNTTGLPHTDRSQDVAYFSAIPWVKFTSVEHASNYKVPNSVPKIAFGKWEERDGKKYMPVSVHVHHALMDGVHVGEFYALLQRLLNQE
ncbi:MAG: CatA-like O-acetyltransferase [Cyclobacteriaceae bacterium]|nr:CatA-like O-acetyltransferase [Cyclobacteriaceae bacterium]